MHIEIDDLAGEEIAAFLAAHLADMRATSPPESKHALDLDGLRKPDVTFWTLRDGGTIVGCGALKALDPSHGEIKSMRTDAACRGRGLGSRMVRHLIEAARACTNRHTWPVRRTQGFSQAGARQSENH